LYQDRLGTNIGKALKKRVVFPQVGELNDFVELYSYWTFSDVFEEGGLPVRARDRHQHD
jgi:hypothetical protein